MKSAILCLMSFMLLSAPIAEARDRRDRDDRSEGQFLNPGRRLSADEAVDRASARNGGRPLSVRRASEGGRAYFDVKMLSRGEVWTERVYSEDDQ